MNPRKRKLLKLRAAQKAASTPEPEPVVEIAPPDPEPAKKPITRRTAKQTKSSEG